MSPTPRTGASLSDANYYKESSAVHLDMPRMCLVVVVLTQQVEGKDERLICRFGL